jgi:hypothetical protein
MQKCILYFKPTNGNLTNGWNHIRYKKKLWFASTIGVSSLFFVLYWSEGEDNFVHNTTLVFTHEIRPSLYRIHGLRSFTVQYLRPSEHYSPPSVTVPGWASTHTRKRKSTYVYILLAFTFSRCALLIITIDGNILRFGRYDVNLRSILCNGVLINKPLYFQGPKTIRPCIAATTRAANPSDDGEQRDIFAQVSGLAGF